MSNPVEIETTVDVRRRAAARLALLTLRAWIAHLPPGLQRLLILVLVAPRILAAEDHGRPSVPPGAAFRVEFDKAEYVLGENILAHAILSNEGTEKFRASFGGDYRALGRSDRFKITVTDSDGTVLPDPLERRRGMDFGGMGDSPDLKPGDEWVESLPLCLFARLAKAGRYRVQITHDFGWRSADRKLPIAEADLVVRMPTPEEAEVLVAKAAAEEFSGATFGKRSPEHASYAALYHPIFLPLLRGLAEQADANAANAIAEIETPEATGVLIGLLASPVADVSDAASRSLRPRVQFVRPLDASLDPWPTGVAREAARAFGERCWNPELAAPLASQARRWFEHGTPEQREQAIHFLGHVGDARDVAPILECIRLELLQLSHFDTDDFVSDPPRDCRAGVTALRRLDPEPDELKEEGGLYYLVVAPSKGKAAHNHLHAALESVRPALRKAALQALPEPLPPEFRPAVIAALRDSDAGVCSAAADVAAKDKDPSYRPAVIALLASERNVWALRSASAAALSLDARYEAARAWAAQLDNSVHWYTALLELRTIVVGGSSGSGHNIADRQTIIALRKRWEDFLAKHQRDIRKGRVFEPGEPALPEDLFAPHMEIERKNGTRWPPKK